MRVLKNIYIYILLNCLTLRQLDTTIQLYPSHLKKKEEGILFMRIEQSITRRSMEEKSKSFKYQPINNEWLFIEKSSESMTNHFYFYTLSGSRIRYFRK